MSHFFSFRFRNTQYLWQRIGCLFKNVCLKCRLYRRLASFIDVHLNVIDILWGRRAHLFSNNVHEVWSWSSFNRWLRRCVTSRHVLGRRLVSTSWCVMLTSLTLWTPSINRSQSHHRKQMWRQMLITCNGKWTFLLVPIPICMKTRSKLV